MRCELLVCVRVPCVSLPQFRPTGGGVGLQVKEGKPYRHLNFSTLDPVTYFSAGSGVFVGFCPWWVAGATTPDWHPTAPHK